MRDQRLVGFLLRALGHEMAAAQHYLMQANLVELWGQPGLAAGLRADAQDELRHAETLMRRLLAYGVAPGGAQLFPVRLGRSVAELLAANRAVELAAVRLYEEALEYCRRMRNTTDGGVFADLLDEELKHLDRIGKHAGAAERNQRDD
ncbi:MAG: bacterioferritin [Sulfuritalea sp.]|nr:bacterioferritin [Sulfuritalea sp.]